jgi:hypothetical protein
MQAAEAYAIASAVVWGKIACRVVEAAKAMRDFAQAKGTDRAFAHPTRGASPGEIGRAAAKHVAQRTSVYRALRPDAQAD